MSDDEIKVEILKTLHGGVVNSLINDLSNAIKTAQVATARVGELEAENAKLKQKLKKKFPEKLD